MAAIPLQVQTITTTVNTVYVEADNEEAAIAKFKTVYYEINMKTTYTPPGIVVAIRSGSCSSISNIIVEQPTNNT